MISTVNTKFGMTFFEVGGGALANHMSKAVAHVRNKSGKILLQEQGKTCFLHEQLQIIWPKF